MSAACSAKKVKKENSTWKPLTKTRECSAENGVIWPPWTLNWKVQLVRQKNLRTENGGIRLTSTNFQKG